MKKSKKLMLLSIGAMSAVAVATGTVSTMAWFAASASINATGANADTISVTKVDANVGGLTVPMLLTVEDANQSHLVQAHYAASPDTNPHLESGYVDGAGNFVSVAAANIETAFGAGAIISSTLTVKIAIDYNAERTAGTKYWSGTGASRVYSDGINSFDVTTMTTLFSTKTVSVGIKSSSESKGRIFVDSAVSGDTDLAGVASENITNGYYVFKTGQSLAGIMAADDTKITVETTPSYYVYGGTTNGVLSPETQGFTVSFDCTLFNA